MKMKEVLQQTGLTDRAVRLYIDSGLVAPNIEESYSGRKNIEFSENDIDRLKNIALLRKIGFSIPDIKGIAEGGENTKSIIEAFVQQKQESVENDTLVLEKLKSLSFDTQITMDSLCEKLSSIAFQKSLPQADSQISEGEKIEKRICRIFSLIGILFSSAAILFLLCHYKSEFIYTKFYQDGIGLSLVLFLCLILMLLLSFLLWQMYKNTLTSKRKKKQRRVLTAIISVFIVSLITATPICIGLNMLIPSVYSQTQDIGNYLVLDEYVRLYADDIYKLFPGNIPYSALSDDISWDVSNKNIDTAKYFYRYENSVDPSFDIVAEWVLPKDEYEQAKRTVYRANDVTETVENGEWTCLYFFDKYDNTVRHSFYYLIFAYNDKINTVRYIASYCMDTANGAYKPYYLSLEW
ncbi:MAG: MerR family transcriptional regulator [Clostridia bacterium]|nr:MerR family transcriptional regulator [Clostridia bacterium]